MTSHKIMEEPEAADDKTSSVEGPSGTNKTITVHQIESRVSALARLENDAYCIEPLY